MKKNGNKIQLTIRIEPDVYRAAKALERKTRSPLSVIINDAARETLLPQERESLSHQLDSVANRLLQRLTTLERSLGGELIFIKEFIAVWTRSYFNHTHQIPDPERTVATLSGRARWTRMKEVIQCNIQQGISILNEQEGTNGTEQEHAA